MIFLKTKEKIKQNILHFIRLKKQKKKKEKTREEKLIDGANR